MSNEPRSDAITIRHKLESWLSRFPWYRRRAREADLERELRDHIELEAEEQRAVGLSSQEAANAAHRALGNTLKIEEDVRAAWGLQWLETVAQDLRYGLRMLRKSPGFTAVAVLTLALGIGANTMIFSAADGIFLAPLPYADASRLVTIERAQVAWGMYPEEIEDLQKQCPAFDRVTVFAESPFGVVHSGEDVTFRKATYVPADFFSLLGVKPLLGRVIIPQDTQLGGEHVAVLSYLMWRDAFGSDANILGRRILISNFDQSLSQYFTVVGVMPREFELGIDWFGEKQDGLWEPLAPSPPDRNGRLAYTILARLKNGISIAEARAEVKTVSARFEPLFAPGTEHIDLLLNPVERNSAAGFRDLRIAFLTLLGAVGFVLLLACVNLSALLTARAWARQREIAIRQTLGASRSRVIRQLLVESLLLAVGGGALGLFLSFWGIRLVLALLPPGTPRLDRVVIDARVLLFTMAISLLSAILFGFMPALQRSARRFGCALPSGWGGSFPGSATHDRHLLRSVLVIAEVALAVVLVAGSALMIRSFERLIHQNMGFRSDHVLMMQVELSRSNCAKAVAPEKNQLKDKSQPSRQKNRTLSDDQKESSAIPKPCPAMEAALASVQSLKDVQSVALQSFGSTADELIVEGGNGEAILYSGWLSAEGVGPGYFGTMGIRLLRGRDFVSDDAESGQEVAIVSEGFAHKYFSGEPLGRRFRLDFEHQNPHGPWTQIVGVVNDVRLPALINSNYQPTDYYTPSSSKGSGGRLVVRTTVDPMAMASSIERVIRDIDSRASIGALETMDQMVREAAAEPRFQTVLLGSFGGLGLLLAVIGIYGVISYDVVQRTHEIGVRMALGASPADALLMVVREGMILASAGIVIGIGGALALTRLLASFLFEIKPNDPATFAMVAVALALAALVATYIPARRAMRVDSMVVLRYE